MTLDRDLLIKFLGMLGSEHDGEVLAAARKATAALKAANLTWADVILQERPAAGSPQKPSAAADHATGDYYYDMARAAERVRRGWVARDEMMRREVERQQREAQARYNRQQYGGIDALLQEYFARKDADEKARKARK